QDFVEDGAIHDKVLLAEIGDGLANSRAVLAAKTRGQFRIPRLWLGPFGFGRSGWLGSGSGRSRLSSGSRFGGFGSCWLLFRGGLGRFSRFGRHRRFWFGGCN